MVELIPPPDPRSLLPPLLACLPTAFASPLPPPALLPLLSPILRQRVQILTSVSSHSAPDSWLRLLCWDATKAERLWTIAESANFEPHPVSGEIELPSDIPVGYKRVDEETLQSRMVMGDYGMTATYLWCPTDPSGEPPAWRLAELLPQEGSTDIDGSWSPSIGEANARSKEQLMEDALKAAEKNEQATQQPVGGEEEEEDDDDDDYWAQYDATPGRTPAVKTPAPNADQQNTSEASYFSRYEEVQPAMDNHDPQEEQPEVGPTSLNGDMLASLLQRQINGAQDEAPHSNGDEALPLNHPKPSSTPSSNPDAVNRLEHEAEHQSACEIGVKQHIGSSIKSLFRLAKATGISRSEFQSLVQTEVDLLNVSDAD